MKLFRTDRLYEEAARSPEGRDELLKRLQRARALSLFFILGLSVLGLALCVGPLVLCLQFIHSPTLSASPVLDWLLAHRELPWVCGAPLISGIVIQFILMLHCDTCIKMLLFLRGQQVHLTPGNDNDRKS